MTIQTPHAAPPAAPLVMRADEHEGPVTEHRFDIAVALWCEASFADLQWTLSSLGGYCDAHPDVLLQLILVGHDLPALNVLADALDGCVV